ncbi:MAG: prolipoprotein diacylglyceryl transferase [Actinobacteria bacterium]|nr:prolipoprotein diacylglyceryl transferase [Actinomycetota bacterium]
MDPALAAIGWPVLDRFRFGSSFAISPHGLGIAIGFMIGASLLTRIGPPRIVPDDGVTPTEELERRRENVRADLDKMLFWALVGTIVGARLFYVIAHFSEFNGFIDMLEIWKGGISLLGGIAGAVLINLPRMRKLGYGFFSVMDPSVVALALGIGIGRVGDLVIGDHLGKPAQWLLAWQYRGGALPGPWVETAPGRWAALLTGGYVETLDRAGSALCKAPVSGLLSCTGQPVLAHGVGVHQTALYDMMLAWVLFAALWQMQKWPRRLGVLTLTFGAWYGCMRLLEDSLRIDKRFGPLTGSQWTALVVALVCAATLTTWAIRKDRAAPPASGLDDHERAGPVPA